MYNESRKFSIVQAVVEALMLCNKADGLKYFSWFNPNMAQFSDDGVHFHGQYGLRIIRFIHSVVHKLKKDKDSRQASVAIYRNGMDCWYEGKDTPCTLDLHFMIRNNKLDMTVMMRSNDIIWGVPYDVFMFTCLQEVIANELEIDVGDYVHFPISLHVYKKHYDMLDEVS